MNPADYRARYPEFPWLTPGDCASVERLLETRGWLGPGETVETCDKAGEGNMNLTLRVRTPERTLILKQARPWVEKYDQIAAPWERSLVEQRFYRTIERLPAVRDGMPKLLGADSQARVLLLEDLKEARDLSLLYAGRALTFHEADALAGWLRALHDGTLGAVEGSLANNEMRALNHQHIHVIPLQADNGIDLDRLEPGLAAAAARWRSDDELLRRVQEAGERYLATGACLLHGDFFPGSWLRTAAGVRVIDPEFCFPGDPEFDLGVAVGHLALARQVPDLARAFLDAYASSGSGRPLDRPLVARTAGIEIMRRLIGVAQLPIPPVEGLRVGLLERAAIAVRSGEPLALWS